MKGDLDSWGGRTDRDCNFAYYIFARQARFCRPVNGDPAAPHCPYRHARGSLRGWYFCVWHFCVRHFCVWHFCGGYGTDRHVRDRRGAHGRTAAARAE